MPNHFLPCRMLVELRMYDHVGGTWGAFGDYALYNASGSIYEYLDGAEQLPFEAPDYQFEISSMQMSNGMEFRFTHQQPIACVIRWREGVLSSFPIGTISWGAEQFLTVIPGTSETITTTPVPSRLDVAEVLGVRFHPWS